MPTSATQYNPRFGILVAVVAAAVGVIYGYDNGAISGALPFLTKQYSLSSAEQGAVTSTVVIGSMIGAFFSGRIADAAGRKVLMLSVASGFTIFALLQAIPVGVVWLMVMRFCLGLFIGASIVAAPLFIAEQAPARIRGALLVSFQIAQTIGIIAANFVDFGFSSTGNWEAMLGISFIPALLISLSLIPFPDTPRWHVMKGRRDKAVELLRRSEPPENIETELRLIDNELASHQGRIREMFTRQFRLVTVFALVFGFLVHITGINAIVYYAPIIFKSIGLGTSNSILIAALIQVSSLVAEIVAFILIDRWGRRPILLVGIGAMVIGMLALTILFAVGVVGGGGGIYPAFGAIVLFNMGFNFGFGCLVWTYASECFPIRLRAAGASLLMTADLVSNFIVTEVFPQALHNFGGAATFGGFLVLSFLAWIFVFRLAPETKHRSLEEIRYYWQNGARWPSETPTQN
jgi:sugar porter (SP) family MFS transporter